MSTSRKRQEASHLFQTLLKHVWNLLELCYKEKQTLRVCNITTALRILIFNIRVLEITVINAICLNGLWSHYGKYDYADHSHTLEKLLLKFQVASSKNAHVNLNELKKKKILEFGLHFRLSINEVEEYMKLKNISNSDNCYVKTVYSKLLKCKKQMLQTLNVKSSNERRWWVKRYLKIMKNYKSVATEMSMMLGGCKGYLSDHPHVAFCI